MATTDMPQLTAQVCQFDRNPGRRESVLVALYQPSATAVASYTSQENKAKAIGTTAPPSVVYSSTAHQDVIRNAADSASRVH
jgi:hypothetical protein